MPAELKKGSQKTPFAEENGFYFKDRGEINKMCNTHTNT